MAMRSKRNGSFRLEKQVRGRYRSSRFRRAMNDWVCRRRPILEDLPRGINVCRFTKSGCATRKSSNPTKHRVSSIIMGKATKKQSTSIDGDVNMGGVGGGT
jgi:hypothetical protein